MTRQYAVQREFDHLDVMIRIGWKDEQLRDPYVLHDLCLRQEIDLLLQLLEARRHPVNGRNQNGLTPLQVAVVSAQPPYLEDLINYLLFYDADPDARCTPDGNTALHLAVIYSKLVHAEISVPLLLKSGAIPNLVNYAGRTPKDYALAKGCADLAALLDAIEKDPKRRGEIDVYNWKEKFGAEKRPDEELLQTAIEHGDAETVADLTNRMNTDGSNKTDSLLCYHLAVAAARQNRVKVIDTLSGAGVSASKVDEDGNTPIQLAVSTMPHGPEMVDVIKALLKAGVPKATKNKENKDALSMATERGYRDVEELLAEKKPPPPPAKAASPKPPPPKPAAAPAAAAAAPELPLSGGHTIHEIITAKGLTIKQRLQRLEQLWASNPRTNPNVRSADGSEDTPLHVTVRRDQADLTEFLLNKNAIVNVRNKRGETPLSLAERTDFGFSLKVLEQLRETNRRQQTQKQWNELSARIAESGGAVNA